MYGGTAGEMARLVNESGIMGSSFEATAENVKDIPFDQLIEAIHQTQVEMDITGTTAKEASETVSGSFDSMKAAGQNLLAGLGDSTADIGGLMEDLGGTVKNFAKNIKGVLATIWDNLPLSGFQKWAGVIAVATGPVLWALGAIFTNVKRLAVAFKVLKTFMLANPIVLIVVALVALGVALYTAYNKSEEFRNAVDKLFNAFKNHSAVKELLAIIKGLAEKFMSVISPMKKTGESINFMEIGFGILKGVITALLIPITLLVKVIELVGSALSGSGISDGVQSVIDGFSNMANGVREAGAQVGASVGAMLGGILIAIANAIPGIVIGALAIVSGFIIGIAQGLPMITIAAIQLIVAFTAAMLVMIPTVVASATLIIVSFLGSLTASLPLIIMAGTRLIVSFILGLTIAIPRIVTALVSLFVVILGTIAMNMPRILAAGVNLIVTFLRGVINNLPKVITTVGNLIVAFLNALTNELPKIITSGANLLVKFLEGIAKKIPDVITAATDVIVAFIDGIADNLDRIINSAAGLIVAFLQGIADKIPDIVNAAWDIVDALVKGILDSQNRLTTAMVTLMNGLAENINNSAPQIKKAAAGLLTAMIYALPGGGLIKAGVALAGGLLGGLKKGFEKVKTTVSGWAGWIKENKGPISYDKRLLVGAGDAIVYGLNKGLVDSFVDVKKTVGSMASQINDMFMTDVSPSINLNGSIARSNAQINSIVSHEINNAGKQPAYLNLSIGGHSYVAFVEDISEEQGKAINLQSSF